MKKPEGSVGLTLGKFAPFHRGHQLLVEKALEENERVYVLIYGAPEVTAIPLSVRAQWVRSLYPSVQVIECPDGPSEVGLSPEIKKKQESYILQKLKGVQISNFYSSEPYGEHVSACLGAADRRVDPERKAIPVSGSLFRSDPFQFRSFVSPVVYRDYVTHAVFLGAPSTGKSTLVQKLAECFDTVWTPEYGREYWARHQVNRRLSLDQLLEIARGHLESEDEKLLRANRILFTDTSPLTTRQFSLYYHGRVHPDLEELAHQSSGRYDLTFVCDMDFPYDDSWDRSGEVQRTEFQKQILADLESRKIKYSLLSGSVAERVDQVKKILGGFEKYR